jgi:hypothetical protein
LEVLSRTIARQAGERRPAPDGRRTRTRVKRLTTFLIFGSIGVNYTAAIGWLITRDSALLSLLAPSMVGLAGVAALDMGVWYYYDGRLLWRRLPSARAVAEPRVLAPVLYGLVYAWLEQGYIATFASTATVEYRAFYLAALILPFYSRNLMLWLADALAALTTEDLAFWAFKFWLPGQWAWYYPTFMHVPLLDLLALGVVPLLYWWVHRRELRWSRGPGASAECARPKDLYLPPGQRRSLVGQSEQPAGRNGRRPPVKSGADIPHPRQGCTYSRPEGIARAR